MSEDIRHVEMYDGRVFCGVRDGREYRGVLQGDWHAHAVALKHANCVACLDRIWALGQVAGDVIAALRKETP